MVIRVPIDGRRAMVLSITCLEPAKVWRRDPVGPSFALQRVMFESTKVANAHDASRVPGRRAAVSLVSDSKS